jgi:hypothetical protein
MPVLPLAFLPPHFGHSQFVLFETSLKEKKIKIKLKLFEILILAL